MHRKYDNEHTEIECNGSLTIRNARSEDYESVRDLEELDFILHWNARPDFFKAPAGSYSRQEYEELLAMPCPISWLAVLDERIVGLCFGKIEMTTESDYCKSRRVAFLEDIVTLPEYRGRGIATKLIAEARAQAVAEGAETLELCVWNFNKNAVQLYERLGMSVQYSRMEEKLT